MDAIKRILINDVNTLFAHPVLDDRGVVRDALPGHPGMFTERPVGRTLKFTWLSEGRQLPGGLTIVVEGRGGERWTLNDAFVEGPQWVQKGEYRTFYWNP